MGEQDGELEKSIVRLMKRISSDPGRADGDATGWTAEDEDGDVVVRDTLGRERMRMTPEAYRDLITEKK